MTRTKPPEPQPAARQRMVAGAADMIRRRGLAATSVRELAKHSGAPLGSTYHYFPGGKEQLATEAVLYAGDVIGGVLTSKLEAGPLEGLRAFLELWRGVITRSEFGAGCPVLAVAVEEPAGEETEALRAAAGVFTGWENQLARSLREHGVTRKAANQLATLIVAALEGTVAMCRAKRSTEPLDRIAPALEALVGEAIGEGRAASAGKRPPARAGDARAATPRRGVRTIASAR